MQNPTERTPMYVVKKCENHTYGQNKWKVIYTSPDRDGAVAIFKQELRYELEADPNLTRDDIDRRLQNYYLDNNNSYYTNRRIEMGHGDVYFSIMKSAASEHVTPAERPTRTELLDSILS